MPDMTAPTCRPHREIGVGLPVIYLTGQCTLSMGVRAMKSGASDFLEKPIDENLLLPAIDQAISEYRNRRAHNGRLNEIRDRLQSCRCASAKSGPCVSGQLDKQIAADLGIAEKTVKVHRAGS